MPLARIITRTPEQVAALSEYLRSRGYTVELIEPGTLRTTPAELEMDLHGRTAEEALSQISAADAASGYPRRQAIAYDITGRPVEFADEEDEPPAKGSNALAQAWNGLAVAWREMGENLRLSLGRFGEWFQEGRQAIQAQVARRQERRQAEAEAQLREREHKARLLAHQDQQARLAHDEAARREEAERIRRERAQAARMAEAERARRTHQEASRAAEMAAAQERIRRQQEQQERAARERMVLEQYRREARLDAMQERFQVEQQQVQKEITPAEAVIGRRETMRRPRPAPYGRDRDWNKAAVASVILALLATLGYAAYESRRPASPLSNRDLVNSQKIAQPVPFGTATIAPPQAAPRPVAAPAPQAHTTLPQSDAAPIARNAEPPTRTRRVRRSSHSDDIIADDEVVVHRRSSAAPTRAAVGTSPKRISDLQQ